PPRSFDFSADDQPLLYRLRAMALEIWQLFGLRGYARIDFRVDDRGQPWVLEINANPCLSPDAGFAGALAKAEIPFEGAVEWIVADALRSPQPQSAVATVEIPHATDQTARAAQYSVPSTQYSGTNHAPIGGPAIRSH